TDLGLAFAIDPFEAGGLDDRTLGGLGRTGCGKSGFHPGHRNTLRTVRSAVIPTKAGVTPWGRAGIPGTGKTLARHSAALLPECPGDTHPTPQPLRPSACNEKGPPRVRGTGLSAQLVAARLDVARQQHFPRND